MQGAPRIEGYLRGELREFVDEKAKTIDKWMQVGKLRKLDPNHLLFPIWAITQHYADFEAQICMIRGNAKRILTKV